MKLVPFYQRKAVTRNGKNIVILELTYKPRDEVHGFAYFGAEMEEGTSTNGWQVPPDTEFVPVYGRKTVTRNGQDIVTFELTYEPREVHGFSYHGNEIKTPDQEHKTNSANIRTRRTDRPLVRIRRAVRAARSARCAVRPSFAAKNAARTDSGGGSSDPDGPRTHAKTNTSNTHLHVSAFLFGGAK